MALELKTGASSGLQQTTRMMRTRPPAAPKASIVLRKWPDYDFGSSALLVHGPKAAKSSSAGKNPASSTLRSGRQGKILWQTRVGTGGLNGGVQWGMGQRRQKCTPLFRRFRRNEYRGAVGGATFDPVKGGGLTALHLEDRREGLVRAEHPCDPPATPLQPSPVAALTLIPA